jgi:hypothetical protein
MSRENSIPQDEMANKGVNGEFGLLIINGNASFSPVP